MATVAHLKTLVEALSVPTDCPHAWLDSTFGLVVGTFPNHNFRFDFGKEALIPTVSVIAPKKEDISLLGQAKRVTQLYEIETPETIYTVGSAKQMLVEGLNILEKLKPGTHEKLCNHKKRTKQFVAAARSELYEISRSEKYSDKLKSGYFVATNNKAREAEGFLMDAVAASGLVWGKSFILRKK